MLFIFQQICDSFHHSTFSEDMHTQLEELSKVDSFMTEVCLTMHIMDKY